MNHKKLIPWLTLLHAQKINTLMLNKLLKVFGSTEAICAASPTHLQQQGVRPEIIRLIQQPDWIKIERDLAWVGEQRQIVTFEDIHYPRLLKQTPTPPLLLYVNGNVQLLNAPQLAIVGTRHPTPVGKEIAYQFAKELAHLGLTITSGLAAGIDTAGHQGALNSENIAHTIAVMGTGLNRVYPASNQRLAHEIIDRGGALISEFPLEAGPDAWRFPHRNRIISGLSVGVLVVEATLRSGSLVTARFATEQGREVFTIPGSIHNAQAKGCHQLIRQGAKLVETTQDILEEIAPLLDFVLMEENHHSRVEATDSRPTSSSIENFFGHELTSIDMLVARSGLPVEEVSIMVMELELQGRVLSAPGGYYLARDT